MGADLPQKIQEEGYEIRTFMPKWGNINERRGQLHEVIRLSGMNLVIDDTDHPLIIKVASIPTTRIQVYFIDNDDYFMKRRMATDAEGTEYQDNGQRAIFFARGVLETVKKLRWNPDIIHCQGWMASIVPLFIKKAYYDEPTFAKTKVVTSLFNDKLSNGFGLGFKQSLSFKNITPSLFHDYPDEFSFVDLQKLAIEYSDGVVEAGNNIDKVLMEYAKSRNIPTLAYVEDDYITPYKNLYKQICPEDK